MKNNMYKQNDTQVESPQYSGLFPDPFDFIQPYTVSLAFKSYAPMGSGTLIKFPIPLGDGWVYGVSTATHVIENLALAGLDNLSITLSKPINRSGDPCTAVVPWGLAVTLDKKHHRFIRSRHDGIYKNREHDIALVILSVGSRPTDAVSSSSEFYDLSIKDDEPLLTGDICSYFKGACIKEEECGFVLQNTGVFSISYIEKRRYSLSKVPYLVYKTTNELSNNGASGAGVWFFCKDSNDTIKMSLVGIITSEDSSKNEMYATSREYINNDLLVRTTQTILADSRINTKVNAL